VLEKSQAKVRGRVAVVTMGSLPKLHKTSPLMLGTLHHMGVLDFVEIGGFELYMQCLVDVSYVLLMYHMHLHCNFLN
jgi:hypothetical protein